MLSYVPVYSRIARNALQLRPTISADIVHGSHIYFEVDLSTILLAQIVLSLGDGVTDGNPVTDWLISDHHPHHSTQLLNVGMGFSSVLLPDKQAEETLDG